MFNFSASVFVPVESGFVPQNNVLKNMKQLTRMMLQPVLSIRYKMNLLIKRSMMRMILKRMMKIQKMILMFRILIGFEENGAYTWLYSFISFKEFLTFIIHQGSSSNINTQYLKVRRLLTYHFYHLFPQEINILHQLLMHLCTFQDYLFNQV